MDFPIQEEDGCETGRKLLGDNNGLGTLGGRNGTFHMDSMQYDINDKDKVSILQPNDKLAGSNLYDSKANKTAHFNYFASSFGQSLCDKKFIKYVPHRYGRNSFNLEI